MVPTIPKKNRNKINMFSSPKMFPALILIAGFCFGCRNAEDLKQITPEITYEPGKLNLKSSDQELVRGFRWAKEQAMAYVFEGDPVGKWYEAALPNREAFCMRDLSHQAMGAQALGLEAWNCNMLYKFAVNISESKDWCTYWEINRYDQPAPVDYRNDKEFWYNLPANFDVLDCCWRMYLWTKDKEYLDNPVFLNFYEKTVEDYVERWDLDLNGIKTRERFINRELFDPDDNFHVCRGIPSYHEGRAGRTQLGVDLLAFQQAAYDAYASILRSKGREQEALRYEKKAEKTRNFMDREWWDEKSQIFHAILRTDGSFSDEGGLQALLLYTDALEPGERLKANIRHLSQQPPINIESLSYYPEILYRYGDHERAFEILLNLCHPDTPRREYPEVSFAVIGAIVNGLMGIEPDATAGTIKTLSRLTGNSSWAEIDFLPVFQNEIKVRHNGNHETILTNVSGDELEWKACFFDQEGDLFVDGNRAVTTRSLDTGGNVILWTVIMLPPGKTSRVELK